MPGKQVRNWRTYEALREKGYSKEKAAKIANSQASKNKKTRSKKKGR